MSHTGGTSGCPNGLTFHKRLVSRACPQCRPFDLCSTYWSSKSVQMTYARNKAIGTFGEQVATEHLKRLGMVILARNWTCRFGEIDIVARDGSTLVICEVKTRSSSTYGGPFEAVTGRKAMRLRRLAMHWLEVHDVEPPSVRIDVVSVLLPPRGAPVVERIAGVA